jgi:PAS domain S-box-containing protein
VPSTYPTSERSPDVRITHELAGRPTRPPDYAAENHALGELARQLTEDATGLLDRLVELVLALCRAGSAGLSLLDADGDRFVLPALAGAWTGAPGRTIERDASPSGAVIAGEEPLLFRHPARAYPALGAGEPKIEELLLVPWEGDGKAIGALWVAAHDPTRRFDAEDMRMLQSLARFAAGAWHLNETAAGAQAERDKLRARAEQRAQALSLGYEELRASEERLRLALEISRLGTWDRDLETGSVTWSDENYRILGYWVGEVMPTYAAWAARVHPEDLASTEEALFVARDSRTLFDRIFRIRWPDGEVRWCAAVGRFFTNAQGRPVRMIGVVRDITERHEWSDQQDRLIGELQSRTRTLVGMVRAVGGQPVAAGDTMSAFRARFEERLNTLARAQHLLAQAKRTPVTIGALVRAELAAPNPRHVPQRVSLHGPDVVLHNAAVQMVALAVHELTTNACTHGALSVPNGRLEVTWAVSRRPDDTAWLTLDWREANGPAVPPELLTRRGYGRTLVEEALPNAFGADTTFNLTEHGLTCRIELPLRDGNALANRPV